MSLRSVTILKQPCKHVLLLRVSVAILNCLFTSYKDVLRNIFTQCYVITMTIYVRRAWRSSKFVPFLFFFSMSKVGLPLMGNNAETAV